MPTHDTLQETTFYEELQKKKAWIYGMSVASVII